MAKGWGHQGCDIKGCPNPHLGRGWCKTHYDRWAKTGSPMGSRRPSIEMLILGSVVSESGCWLWQGYVGPLGYGYFNGELAHRLAYEVFVGGIVPPLQIDHLCRTRNCVRPSHLETVTIRENVLRGEGPTARQARQTHCKRGHPFDETNTYRGKTFKGRYCRQCGRDRQAAYQARKRKGVPSQ